jgi:hypothetical protein
VQHPDTALVCSGSIASVPSARVRQYVSASAQKRTDSRSSRQVRFVPIASLCNAANNVLVDYLSGAADQGGWESDSKRPGGLKIDDEFDPYGRSAGLAPLRIRPA